MTERSITISPNELLKLVEWISTFEKSPNVIKIITHSTGIGDAVRAEVDISENEGRFKDLTDYENW